MDLSRLDSSRTTKRPMRLSLASLDVGWRPLQWGLPGAGTVSISRRARTVCPDSSHSGNVELAEDIRAGASEDGPPSARREYCYGRARGSGIGGYCAGRASTRSSPATETRDGTGLDGLQQRSQSDIGVATRAAMRQHQTTAGRQQFFGRARARAANSSSELGGVGRRGRWPPSAWNTRRSGG